MMWRKANEIRTPVACGQGKLGKRHMPGQKELNKKFCVYYVKR